MTTEMILLIGNILWKYGPAVAREVQALFAKKTPTLADWDGIFALADKSYEDYVHPKPKPPVL